MNFNFDLDNAIDEDFFGSLEGKSSKLQQLFMDDVLSAEEKQQTLKYQRPKASDLKTKDVSAENADKTNSVITLMAKIVHAFKQGESQGKVGLALIQNPDENCALIMYKTKANILTNLKLESNKLYKQLKFWQFYDTHNLYWSFSFDTAQDDQEFVERLKLKNIEYKVTEETIKSAEEVSETVDHNEEDFDDSNLISLTKETSSSSNSLIKRMAKMGKPLPSLPNHNKRQITTDYSDSSDTEVINTPLSLQQKPAIAPRSNKFSSIKTNQQLVASTVALNTTPAVSSAIYPINPLESQYMQMLLTEQRTQGSELRMNMNKLENKIEKVLDKLDLYDNRQDGKQKTEKDDEILELEEKLLMLKKENRKLKQTLEEKSKENNFKDYLKNIKEDLEEFNINPSNDFKECMQQLTDYVRQNINEKQLLEEKLKQSEGINKELQKDLFINEIKAKDIEKEMATFKVNEEMLKTNLSEKDEEIKLLKEEISTLRNDLKEKKPETEYNNSTGSLVKTIMNSLYVDIADKLDDANLSHKEQILLLIANSIRKQTFESLKTNQQ